MIPPARKLLMIRASYVRTLTAFALVAASACAAGFQDEPGTGAADAARESAGRSLTPAPVEAGGSLLPVVRLAHIPGFDDDTAYARSIATRVEELAAQASRADDLTKRVDLLAASANLALAHQIEPACTHRLLQFHSDEEVFEEAALRSALDRADELITQAQNTLRKVDDVDDLPEGWSAQSGRRLETLDIFAVGLRAYLLPGAGDEAVRSVRRAVSRLAPLLEDQSPAVTAAANLWQACLKSRYSDPARALSVLGPALADPPRGSMPYAFFARLERCRLIAKRGGPAAALALLMQIEEHCDDWLTDDTARDDAMRTAQLVEIQVLTDWHDRLGVPEHSAERQWCADRIKALLADHFAEDSKTVLRLTSAIPIIADIE